jgi:DHA2 family multidrug resistance protein
MAHWSLQVGMNDIVWTGALQGVGMGLISLPVSTVAFSTLSDELRTDGSAFFSLVRNLGGAIGVAIVSSRIVELTQIHHSNLAQFLTPFRQAGMIAYINGFLLLAVLSVAMLPLVFFLRTPRLAPTAIVAPAD